MAVFDGKTNETIDKIAEALKPVVKIPEWAHFIKTGPGKERLPDDPEWYLKRTAAILRTVYIRGPVGVAKLRVKFGNKKNRGHKPGRFTPAGGKIIRTALQQLEKAQLIEFKKIDNHSGRIVTAKGRSLVDKNTVR
jgi:small subunit ribosomal protein S19e